MAQRMSAKGNYCKIKSSPVNVILWVINFISQCTSIFSKVFLFLFFQQQQKKIIFDFIVRSGKHVDNTFFNM